jgi:cation transport ATPase
MVFSGTAATYGRGKAVVTATGMHTELGNIAGLLSRTEEQTTPLQKELDRVGKLLGGIVLVIAAVVVATILLVEGIRDFAVFLDVLIFGVALAVAAVPEGLPAIVTTTLAQLHRTQAPCGRDFRLGYGDRLRQDRHPHQERDDGSHGRYGERPGRHYRDRIRT